MANARDTYNSSVQSALTMLNTTGATGNTAAAPSFSNNTLQFPSLASIEAAYANGSISAAQRVAYKLASEKPSAPQKMFWPRLRAVQIRHKVTNGKRLEL
jgi:hypothetical protein